VDDEMVSLQSDDEADGCMVLMKTAYLVSKSKCSLEEQHYLTNLFLTSMIPMHDRLYVPKLTPSPTGTRFIYVHMHVHPLLALDLK